MLARQYVGKSKPVSRQLQRRLKPLEIDELVVMYEAGSSVPTVAESFGINRETVMLHLERRGVQRRAHVRKLTDRDVRAAAEHYGSGDSMKSLTTLFGVDATTLRRELAAIGVALRPPGRPRGH
ncbi:MAG: hypothetical protein ACKO91_14415 [Acidimicrobiales bacterium]